MGDLGIDFLSLLGIMEDLAFHMTPSEIAHKHGIASQKVEAVRDTFGEQLDDFSDYTLRKLKRCVTLGMKRVEEALVHDSIAPDKLSPLLNMLIEKHELLAGKPTTRSESRKEPEVTSDQLNAMVDSIKGAEVRQNDASFKSMLPE